MFVTFCVCYCKRIGSLSSCFCSSLWDVCSFSSWIRLLLIVGGSDGNGLGVSFINRLRFFSLFWVGWLNSANRMLVPGCSRFAWIGWLQQISLRHQLSVNRFVCRVLSASWRNWIWTRVKQKQYQKNQTNKTKLNKTKQKKFRIKSMFVFFFLKERGKNRS